MVIKPNKQPIGKTDNLSAFTTHRLQLQSNDIIYLFTDGYADQFGGEKGKKFMYKNLSQVLLSNSHLSMTEQKIELLNTFNIWMGNNEQVDDVLIIGIQLA